MDEHMNGVQISTNDLSQILQLINTLYTSNNPDDKHEANRRLIEVQGSDEIWQLCWLLLDPDQSYPSEAHFFAANALALKINQSFSKLSPEWLENELRPKLFEILVKYSSSPNGTKLVIDRLALALAYFALHSIPVFWPDAIEDILKTFTNTALPVNISSGRVRDILLRILIFIAEEYSILLPQLELRAKLNERISKAGPLVFKFLYTLLIDCNELSQTPDSKQNIFKCLASWTLHSQTTLLELDEGRPLLDRLYEYIPDEELCSGACATIAASFSSPKAENYRNAIIDFIPKIAALNGPIQKYLAEDEVECAVRIYSLVINFCENHCRLFLRILLNDGISLEAQREAMTKQAILDIIKIILECTTVQGTFGHDENYSDIAFPFWFSFFENFYYYNDSYTDTICDLFDPLVDSLFPTLIRKAQYPPMAIYQQTWNDDKRENFRCYRQDLGDNISLIAQFPHAKDRILRQLYEPLVYELSQIEQAKSNQMMNQQQFECSCQKIEAIIFAIKSMSETIPYDEVTYVPKIFDLLTKLPYSDSQVELYCSVAEMMSALSDWLYAHTNHLATAFTILFMGVSSPSSQVRLMSTLALKDLTTECQMELKPYWAQIVNSCIDAILQHGQLLNTSEKSRLMHTIGTTLAITPAEYAKNFMTTLTVPLVNELSVKAQIDPMTDPTCHPLILDRLTMLNSLIESLYIKQSSGYEYEDFDENDSRLYDGSRYDPEKPEVEAIQPALGLIKELVPILVNITNKYRTDEEIMDRISSTVKRSSRSLGIELKPILNDLVSLVVNAYDPIANGSILDSLIPLYFVFKVDKTVGPFLRDAFARICDKTLEVCLANSLRQLSITVERFFDFANGVCKKYPDFLSEQPTPINIEYIYKLAIASLELPEKRTLTNVCNFLTLFRQKSIGIDHLHQIFVNHLDQLLTNVFNIFGGNYNTPRNAVDTVIDMLYFITDAPEVKLPLEKIVEQENFPTSNVTRDQKARLASRLVQERNRNKYKSCCGDFVMASRNLKRLG